MTSIVKGAPLSSVRKPQGRKAAEKLLLRADILISRNKFVEALDACRQALAIEPKYAAAHGRIGGLCLVLQQPQAACDALQKAVALDPFDATALCNLGGALRALGRADAARNALEASLHINAELPWAWFNLAVVLADGSAWEDAIPCYRCALQLAPGHAGAAAGLASALLALGRTEEAEATARAALARTPDDAELHVCLAQALLTDGKLAQGFAEYEWRWKVPHLAPNLRHASTPLWRGEPLQGRRLLVHAEQGFGDTLQMCRFVPLIRDAGHILFEAPAPLVRLLQRLAAPAGSEIDMVERGSDLPPADFQCPVMSLPAAFGMATATDVPKLVPYLTSDPGDVAAWQRRLAPLAGWRIGLCWSSGTRTDLAGRMMQARKSLPLSALAPLGSLANCSFVSLQTGAAASDIYAGDAGFPIIDVSANLADFADTAALIQCLDLVVTIDTAVAHLAGALGAPTAVLLHSSADWRWSASQASAPWYPTCTLFRQARQGNWEDVVAGVCGFADGIRQIAPLF